MKKFFIMVSFLLISLISFCTFSFAGVVASNGNNESELAVVKDTINRYFDARYYMQANLTTEGNLDKFFLPDNDKAREFIEKEKKYLEIDIEHRKLQINDLRFKNYSYNLDYEDIYKSVYTSYCNEHLQPQYKMQQNN